MLRTLVATASALILAMLSLGTHAHAQQRERWPGFAKAGFNSVAAAIDWGNGKVYFFRGKEYLRFDTKADCVDEGYPKLIADHWAGFAKAGFGDGVDAAINWGNGKAYFFSGKEYLRYDIKADCVDEGYPKPIADHWAGFAKARFDKGVDAAVDWGNGKVYFFRGKEYLRFDVKADCVDEGYPKLIADHWAGFAKAGFDDSVRAAINWGNGKAYFFRSGEYLRFDIAADQVDEGFPARVSP